MVGAVKRYSYEWDSMVNKTTLQHIFFDLDRTLWDYDKNVKEALYDLYDGYLSGRVTSDAATFHRIFLFENGRLWEDYTANKIGKDYLRQNRFFFTIRRMGLPDTQMAETLEEAYMALTPAKKNLIPGVHETLSELSKRYALHIMTNGFEDAQNFKLENSGIRQYFDVVVTSDAAKSTKPNREIFLYSESRIKAEPLHCLLVGDDLRADVGGARNAGWQAVHFHPNDEGEGIKELQELLEHL